MRTLASILVLALIFAAPVLAEDLPSPTKAYNALAKKAKRMGGAEKAAFMKQGAEEYLAKWEASGQQASSKHVYSLALFRQAAGQLEQALAGMQAVQKDLELKERTRDLAATAEAKLLLEPALRASLGNAKVQLAVGNLCKYADAMTNPARMKSRSTLRYLLAQLHEAAGKPDDALAMRMTIVAEDPGFLSKIYGVTMRGLLATPTPMDGYDALRKKAAGALKTMTDAQSKILAEEQAKLEKALAKLKAKKPDALDADGNLKQTDRRKMGNEERSYGGAQRKVKSAQDLLERIRGWAAPFDLLGKPAPEWTAEKAFGDVSKIADLEGKVALLYFWGTARSASIGGLPAVRAFARDHAEKGLTVVGVTTTDKVCYESRFDLDPEFSDKASGGRPVYYARLATERVPANESQAIFDEEAYGGHELKAVEAFAKNHEMSWPIVMIPASEPGEKYSLSAWPYLVLLDKRGRVRFLKAGAIQDEADAAPVRKAIEALLGES